MNPADWPDGLAYLIVFVAAIVEGEVIFVTAGVLASRGQLNWLGVLVAAALGGSTGDQFFFYVLRGRLERWLSRFPSLVRRHALIAHRVRQHDTLMVLACRFLPGLRVAIPATCAYAHVPPLKFSLLNLVSAFAWATAVIFVVVWGGPRGMQWIGLEGWWGVLIPAVLVVIFFRWLGRASTRLEEHDPGAKDHRHP